MMTEDEAKKLGNPIFVVGPETKVKKVWFVGSNARDLMAMVYEDPKEGWILKYRWRHYARVMKPGEDGADTAFDGQDEKSVYVVKPKNPPPSEEELESLIAHMDELAEKLVEMFRLLDPAAHSWSQEVENGEEVFEILQTAPWAHKQVVKRSH